LGLTTSGSTRDFGNLADYHQHAKREVCQMISAKFLISVICFLPNREDR
jgi:hypothetical protein